MKNLMIILGLTLLASCGQIDSETLEQCINGDTETCKEINTETNAEGINENSDRLDEIEEEKEIEESLLTFDDVIRTTGAELEGIEFGAPSLNNSGTSATFETVKRATVSGTSWEVQIKLIVTERSVKTTLKFRTFNWGRGTWLELTNPELLPHASDRAFVTELKESVGAENLSNMSNSLPWSSTSEELLMDDVTPITIL